MLFWDVLYGISRSPTPESPLPGFTDAALASKIVPARRSNQGLYHETHTNSWTTGHQKAADRQRLP